MPDNQNSPPTTPATEANAQPKRVMISRAAWREMQGGVSLMTIYRREKLPGYPQPVIIRKRAFYYLDECMAYLAGLRTAAVESAA